MRFDRVLASGLPRTLETATRVLEASKQSDARIEIDVDLQEIRGGRLANIPPEQIEAAFLGAFPAGPEVEAQRFLGGESVGELPDRALPAVRRILDDTAWRCLLLVLHGGVNRAPISSAVAGERAFFDRLEQSPACINVLDAGASELIVRCVDLSPTQWLHERESLTSMEKLLAQYLRGARRARAAPRSAA